METTLLEIGLGFKLVIIVLLVYTILFAKKQERLTAEYIHTIADSLDSLKEIVAKNDKKLKKEIKKLNHPTSSTKQHNPEKQLKSMSEDDELNQLMRELRQPIETPQKKPQPKRVPNIV